MEDSIMTRNPNPDDLLTREEAEKLLGKPMTHKQCDLIHMLELWFYDLSPDPECFLRPCVEALINLEQPRRAVAVNAAGITTARVESTHRKWLAICPAWHIVSKFWSYPN
jgi:hypothetical protein